MTDNPKPRIRMADMFAAFPNQFVMADGRTHTPEPEQRQAVRWADAAIARAQHRTKANAMRPWQASDAAFCAGVAASMYDLMPGLPAWPGQLAKYRPE